VITIKFCTKLYSIFLQRNGTYCLSKPRISVAEQAYECREFPHSSRHHTTIVTTMSEGTGPYNGRLHDVVSRPMKWMAW